MLKTMQETFRNETSLITKRFDAPLSRVGRQAVRVWFNQERLDALLIQILDAFPDCQLVYAIGVDGRQVSSNIQPGNLYPAAYGQDLSNRPIAVNLSALSTAMSRGAFLCDVYISKVTRQPCVTVMYTVTSGASVLGFIAADFDPDDIGVMPV